MFKRFAVLVAVVVMVMVNTVNVFANDRDTVISIMDDMKREMIETRENDNTDIDWSGIWYDENHYYLVLGIVTYDCHTHVLECETFDDGHNWTYKMTCDGYEYYGERKAFEIMRYLNHKYFDDQIDGI